MCVCFVQRDGMKLEALLKEVAETEPPAGAPAPPPHIEEPEIEEDGNMLPSQREGEMSCSMLRTTRLYNTLPMLCVGIAIIRFHIDCENACTQCT